MGLPRALADESSGVPGGSCGVWEMPWGSVEVPCGVLEEPSGTLTHPLGIRGILMNRAEPWCVLMNPEEFSGTPVEELLTAAESS